jgi:hypothetical protein
MRGRWWKRGEKHLADERQVDARALAISYRFTPPEHVDQSDTGRPNGAPEDPLDAEQHRARDRAST